MGPYQETDMEPLCGVLTAIVTPFGPDRGIDEAALRNLVDRQVEAGVHGIVAGSITGEAAALSPAEHERVVELVVDQAAGRLHVMAGTVANNTRLAIELSYRCEDAGAESLLQIPPSYIKPTQDGLIRHYEQVLTATRLPMVLYNVPQRTGSIIQPRTVLRLAEHPRVVGIKQGVSDLEQLNQILAARPASLAVLSGEDTLTLAMVAMGADGVISVAANEVPQAIVRLVAAALEGDRQLAIRLQRRLAPLMAANAYESNPIPVKFALAEMGWIENVLREPMTPLAEAFEPLVLEAIQTATAHERPLMGSTPR